MAVVITSSPGPTPATNSARWMAAVPDAMPIQCFARQKAANSRSKARTSSPWMNCVLAMTRAMASSISGLIAAYCALRSTSGIVIGGNVLNPLEQARRVAGDDRAGRHVIYYHGARAHQRLRTDGDAG